MSASWRTTVVAVLIIGPALAVVLLFAGIWQPGARAEAMEAASIIAELEARVEALETEAASTGGDLSSDAERNLARIADALEGASDRWLREISGTLRTIAGELQSIRRAVER